MHKKLVRHSEFITAIKPLLDLCEVDVNEIFVSIEVEPAEHGMDITFISAVDPADGTEPVTVGDDPESAMNGWPVKVAVMM